MAQFVAKEPGVEVNGAAVLSVVEANPLFKEISRQILAAHKIDDPTPEKWFLQQDWLDSFKEMSEKTGGSTLKLIGKKIPEMALWPPNVDSIQSGLETLDIAYQMNHRGGEIGHYAYSSTGENKGVMVCDNPYPCQFDIGIVEATAAKFAPSGIKIMVTHDPASCRKDGDDECRYNVSWS